MRYRWKTWALTGIAIAAVGVFAVACGDDDDEPDGGDDATPSATEPAGETPSAGGEIDISGVPELEDGKLTVGSDIAYAPIEFYDDSNNAVGLDIDLGDAVAEALGVEIEFQNGGFDSLLPSLDAERYDLIWSAMTINPERSEIVDFIPYFNGAGTGFVVATGNPDGVTADDLCGRTVAVQKATVQVDQLLGTEEAPGGLNGACLAADKEEITVLEFDTNPEAVQALIAGQAQVNLADFPVAAYSAEQSEDALEVLPEQIEPGAYGIAFRKSSTALKDAVQAALDQIIADGTYAEILDKWGVADGAIE